MPVPRRSHAPAAPAAPAALIALLLTVLSSAALPAVLATPAAAATCSQAYLPLPDPGCTPGATYAAVTQATIGSTICVSGWTATIRPSTSYTNPLKIRQIAAYGYSDTAPADYEEDHLIPLELGGNPTDPNNLWPEPRYVINGAPTASKKDAVENKLKSMVCAGTITLAAARTAIARDWTTALATVGGAATRG